MEKSNVIMNNVNVEVVFDFSGGFTDKNRKYNTYDGRYLELGVEKILSNFDCMAYITCPKGKVEVLLQPAVDAEDFKCCELSSSDSQDFLTLVQKEGSKKFETESGEEVEFPYEVVEFLYDNDSDGVWILKEKVRDEIRNIIDNNLEGFIKEQGYEEIDDTMEWVG